MGMYNCKWSKVSNACRNKMMTTSAEMIMKQEHVKSGKEIYWIPDYVKKDWRGLISRNGKKDTEVAETAVTEDGCRRSAGEKIFSNGSQFEFCTRPLRKTWYVLIPKFEIGYHALAVFDIAVNTWEEDLDWVVSGTAVGLDGRYMYLTEMSQAP